MAADRRTEEESREVRFLIAKKRRRHIAEMTSFGVSRIQGRSSWSMSEKKWKRKDPSMSKGRD
jgi:hypothetical protein